MWTAIVAGVLIALATLIWLCGTLHQALWSRWSEGRKNATAAIKKVWLQTNAHALKPLGDVAHKLVEGWTARRWGIIFGVAAVLFIASIADVVLLRDYFRVKLQAQPIFYLAAAIAVAMISVLPGLILDAGGFSIYRQLIAEDNKSNKSEKTDAVIQGGREQSRSVIVIGVLFQLFILVAIMFLADDRVKLAHNPIRHPDAGPVVGSETIAWILLFLALSLALSLLHGVAFDLVNMVQLTVFGVLMLLVLVVGGIVIAGLGGVWIIMLVLGWLFTLLAEVAFAMGLAKKTTSPAKDADVEHVQLT